MIILLSLILSLSKLGKSYIFFFFIFFSLWTILEIADRNESYLEPLKLFLDIFDYCSLFIFSLEIILKWMEAFVPFWRSAWNVFDCLVTFAVSILILVASLTF